MRRRGFLAAVAAIAVSACAAGAIGAERETLSVTISRHVHNGKQYVFAELSGPAVPTLSTGEFVAVVEAIRERHPGAIVLRREAPLRRRVNQLPQVTCDEAN